MIKYKSIFFLILAIGTGGPIQATFFPLKPAADFVKDVMLMILFFVFLHQATKSRNNISPLSRFKDKPLLIIGILSVLTAAGVGLQMILFW
ncbi:hypothetical protein J3A84_14620 [Proteiniclasticum sp. SCR006]|uniref:Uncharacterized protein n=1 Tax=Proteiniclasticum aestuarii TaxID=2817862 RepID=A0A939HD82_9CLOT|nr:hypothetical protein [Proteiniclasticum aestuarii]MBO1266268.1 hypothetical protein [Proteiniclasticum aestuarii]